MRKHLLWALIATCAALAASAPARAQSKWEVSPFVGYETSGTFPITNSPAVNSIRADAGKTFGTFLDYDYTDNLAFEFMWNRNTTSFSARNVKTGVYSEEFDSDIDQYQFGALYLFRSPDKKLRPYVGGGLGFAHNSNSGESTNQTAFSFNLGGGVKYKLAKHFGLRGDIRYLPTYENSSPSTYCDVFGNCYLANSPNFLSRFNFSGGITIRF